MPDEIDVHGVAERQSGNGAIGHEARDQKREKKHRGSRERIADDAAQSGFDPRVRCEIRRRRVGSRRSTPDAGGQHCHDGEKHRDTDDQHRDPKLEEDCGLRAGRHLNVV